MNNDALILFLRDFCSLFIELVTAIIGTAYFYKYRKSILKHFLIYLWFIVFIEYAAYIMREYFEVTNNSWWFNFFYVVNFTYLLYLYKSVVRNPIKKKTIRYAIAIYIATFVINGFFENYLVEHQTIPFVVGSCLLILAIILYFAEILGSEKVLYAKKNLLFWISIGLLLFYVGYIPLRITINYYAGIGKLNPLYSILYILIIVSNICFMTGFIWGDKKQLY